MSLLAFFGSKPVGRPSGLHYSFPESAPYNVSAFAITPTDDGTGQACHPDVIDFGPDGWRGWRYWMANTAFYKVQNSQENPHILVSRDGWLWRPPEGLTNPIDPWPGAESNNHSWYNSDTDMVYDPDADQLICTYREVHGKEQRIRARTSSDGVVWSDEIPLITINDGGYNATSQALVRVSDGEWRMYLCPAVDSAPSSPNNRVLTAPSALGPWSVETAKQVWWMQDGAPGVTPYHGDVIYRDGLYYAIFQRGGAEYPAISTDGITFTTKAPVLVAATINGLAQSQYRSTMQIDPTDPSMVGVWYQANNDTKAGEWWGIRICYTRIPLSEWTG